MHDHVKRKLARPPGTVPEMVEHYPRPTPTWATCMSVPHFRDVTISVLNLQPLCTFQESPD